MKTIIHAKSIAVVGVACTAGLVIEIEMSEKQMFSALNQFLHFVSDDTWAQWQRQINAEIYGQPQVVTT
jgi:maltose-binding protein MalE